MTFLLIPSLPPSLSFHTSYVSCFDVSPHHWWIRTWKPCAKINLPLRYLCHIFSQVMKKLTYPGSKGYGIWKVHLEEFWASLKGICSRLFSSQGAIVPCIWEGVVSRTTCWGSEAAIFRDASPKLSDQVSSHWGEDWEKRSRTGEKQTGVKKDGGGTQGAWSQRLMLALTSFQLRSERKACHYTMTFLQFNGARDGLHIFGHLNDCGKIHVAYNGPF